MDTEKQRQRRRDGARLTENGNARSEQLLVVPKESLTNRQRLLGDLLSGSERRRPSWFFRLVSYIYIYIYIGEKIYFTTSYPNPYQYINISWQPHSVVQFSDWYVLILWIQDCAA